MRSTFNEDFRINYDIRGNGPPAILFSHSGASSLAWREVFLESLAASLTVITIDARGTGHSSPVTAEFALSNLAADGLAVLKAEKIETAIIIGTSMGGSVAQEFALSYPASTATLVLLGTFAGGQNFVLPNSRVLELLQPPPGPESKVERILRMLPATFSAGFLESHNDLALELELKGNRFTTDETIKWHRVAVGKFEAYERLPAINVPTLIVHGTEDPIITFENGKILSAQIPGSRFVPLEGVGHLPATEKPVRTARIITEFCAGL